MVRCIETAKTADIYTGGEVKYFDLAQGKHNLVALASDVTVAELRKQMSTRGLVMSMRADGKHRAPFKLKDVAASMPELGEAAAKIESGELAACAPCDSIHRDWTDQEKSEFNKALAKAFKW